MFTTATARNNMAEKTSQATADIKDGIHATQDDARDAAHILKDDLQDVARQAGRHVRDVADAAGRNASDAAEMVSSKIQSNPLQALGIAAGVGFVIGLLFRR